MTDAAVKTILANNSDYFHAYNLLSSFVRWIGWWLVKALKWLVDGAEDVVSDMITLFGFITSTKVNTFISNLMPLFIVLFCVSVIFLGYRMLIQQNFDRSAIPTNILLIILIFTSTTIFFSQMVNMTTKTIDSIEGVQNNSSYSDNLLKNNLVDLVYLDSIEFDYENDDELNQIRRANVKYIEINDTVDPDNDEIYELKCPKVFEHRIVILPDTGRQTLVEIPHGAFDIMPNLYYRYHVDWFTVYVTLISLALVLCFTAYKFGRIGFELAFHKVILAPFAATDLSDGRRIREVIKSILSLFAVILVVLLLLKFYFVYVSYIKLQYNNDKIGDISYGVALIVAALAVIDGPNIIERVLGIDAGLKSGYQTMIGAMALGRGAMNMARGARDIAIGNPMTRSTYVDADGKEKRSFGGIVGTIQRAKRNSEPGIDSSSGIAGNNQSGTASPHTNNSSAQDASGAGYGSNGITSETGINSPDSINGTTPEQTPGGIGGADATRPAGDNPQNGSGSNLPRSDMKKQNKNPIRASIAYNPTGGNLSPHGNVSAGFTVGSGQGTSSGVTNNLTEGNSVQDSIGTNEKSTPKNNAAHSPAPSSMEDAVGNEIAAVSDTAMNDPGILNAEPVSVTDSSFPADDNSVENVSLSSSLDASDHETVSEMISDFDGTSPSLSDSPGGVEEFDTNENPASLSGNSAMNLGAIHDTPVGNSNSLTDGVPSLAGTSEIHPAKTFSSARDGMDAPHASQQTGSIPHRENNITSPASVMRQPVENQQQTKKPVQNHSVQRTDAVPSVTREKHSGTSSAPASPSVRLRTVQESKGNSPAKEPSSMNNKQSPSADSTGIKSTRSVGEKKIPQKERQIDKRKGKDLNNE